MRYLIDIVHGKHPRVHINLQGNDFSVAKSQVWEPWIIVETDRKFSKNQRLRSWDIIEDCRVIETSDKRALDFLRRARRQVA